MPLTELMSVERIGALADEGVRRAMREPGLRAQGPARLRAAITWALTHVAVQEYRRKLEDEGYIGSTGYSGAYWTQAATRAQTVDRDFWRAFGCGVDFDLFVGHRGGSLGSDWLPALVKEADR